MMFRFLFVSSVWTVSVDRLGILKEHKLAGVPQPTAVAMPDHPFTPLRFCDSLTKDEGGGAWEQETRSPPPAGTTLTTNPGGPLTQS